MQKDTQQIFVKDKCHLRESSTFDSLSTPISIPHSIDQILRLPFCWFLKSVVSFPLVYLEFYFWTFSVWLLKTLVLLSSSSGWTLFCRPSRIFMYHRRIVRAWHGMGITETLASPAAKASSNSLSLIFPLDSNAIVLYHPIPLLPGSGLNLCHSRPSFRSPLHSQVRTCLCLFFSPPVV